MFQLPNITEMNQRAATADYQARLQRMIERLEDEDGDALGCEFCDAPAARTELYYDVFSPEAKGVAAFCEEHDGYWSDTYFHCDGCDRLHVLNYTWEYYRHVDDGGNELCLPCYAREYLADDGNWIPLTAEGIESVDFEQVRRAPHLIAVRMPIPDGIEPVGAVSLDSTTGGLITGLSSSEPSMDGALGEIRALLKQARAEGNTSAVLILDGAYQFSVSVGVYVDVRKVSHV